MAISHRDRSHDCGGCRAAMGYSISDQNRRLKSPGISKGVFEMPSELYQKSRIPGECKTGFYKGVDEDYPEAHVVNRSEQIRSKALGSGGVLQ